MSDDNPNTSGHLRQLLGLTFGIAVGVGTIIGGGILRTPGTVFDHAPSVAVVLLLWLIGGVHAALGANVVSELFTAVPRSGGLFVIALRAFGPIGGLIVGWTDWLLNVASVGSLAIASAEFAGLLIPAAHEWAGTVAVGLVALFLAINWLGVRQGGQAQIITSAAKGILILVLIAVVFLEGEPPRATSIAAPQALSFAGIIIALQLIVGVYSGWASPGCFIEEQKSPGRNVPRSIFISVLVVTALYLLMNGALLYALPAEALRSSRLPLSLAVESAIGGVGLKLVAVAAIATTVSCLNASLMVSVRILYGLGRDSLFPNIAARVDSNGVPWVALAVSGLVAILLAATGEYVAVFLVVGALAIFNNAISDAAYFRLRRSEPELQRPYRAKGHPVLPALILLIDVGLVVAFFATNPRNGLYTALAIALAIPLWILAKRRRAAEVDKPCP